MEKLFFDLSESEFSQGRKILVWIFSAVFFLAGCGIIFMNTVLHDRTIHMSFAFAPFGISIFAAIVAYLATTKRKDHYFLMDNEKIEYRIGMFSPDKITHNWSEVNEIVIPHKEKKVLLKCKNGTEQIVNLNWIEKKKSHFIRKHFYYAAREKNIGLTKVMTLPKK
ncbi:MAG TPA: hypothetical protein VMT63_00950 [Bacteroidales bacterium]|nr:hypothetical protein [Bacteroidales bacterium]